MKLLYTISGEDPALIHKASTSEKAQIRKIGKLILLLHALCFLGTYMTFFNLSQNSLISVASAILMTLMLMNIYKLNLITFNPSIKDDQLSSFLLRLSFVAFIGFALAKPIELSLFQDSTKALFEDYLIENHRINQEKVHLFYENKIALLKEEIDKAEYNFKNELVIEGEGKLNLLKSQLHHVQQERLDAQHHTNELLVSSSYFIRKIILLGENKATWLSTLFIVFLFVLPVFMKRKMGLKGDFIEFKTTLDLKLIKQDYLLFTDRYNRLISSFNNDPDFEIFQRYTNPPFNTTLKVETKRKMGSETDFLNSLSND